MSGIISYSGIATKTRAMRGKLLTREDYASLAELKSVADAVTYLRQHTAYGGLLKEVTESRLHRGVVEELLLRSLYEDFNKIYYLFNKNFNIYTTWCKRNRSWEEALKTFCRTLLPPRKAIRFLPRLQRTQVLNCRSARP